METKRSAVVRENKQLRAQREAIGEGSEQEVEKGEQPVSRWEFRILGHTPS